MIEQAISTKIGGQWDRTQQPNLDGAYAQDWWSAPNAGLATIDVQQFNTIDAASSAAKDLASGSLAVYLSGSAVVQVQEQASPQTAAAVDAVTGLTRVR